MKSTTKDHGPQIKNEKQYEALRKDGMSQQKAARIANSPGAGRRGGQASEYEDRTKEDLYKKRPKWELRTALRCPKMNLSMLYEITD